MVGNQQPRELVQTCGDNLERTPLEIRRHLLGKIGNPGARCDLLFTLVCLDEPGDDLEQG